MKTHHNRKESLSLGLETKSAKGCGPIREILVVVASFIALLFFTANHLHARQQLDIIYSADVKGYVDPCG